MKGVQPISLTLPEDLAEMVSAKVASGEYASEADVVSDGLRALRARDRGVEDWLLEEIVPAYDALEADPARGRSVAEVRASLAAEHKRTKTDRR